MKSTASILDCFQDLISIRGGCDEIIPSSGVYLDDMGISIANIDEFITKDYQGSYDLFTKKRDFALKLITNQITNFLSDRYLSTSLIESQRLGFFQDNLQQVAATAGKRKGINIEFNNLDSYVDLYVSELDIQLNYSGAVNIRVYDLLQNKLIDTIPITAVANEIISVFPAKTYKSNRKKLNLNFEVWILDSNGNEVLASANTTYLRGGNNCATCGGGTYSNSYLNARAISIGAGDTRIKSNLSGESATGGLSIVYSLTCNHQDWLCNIAQSIAVPLAYKTAYELMAFAMEVSSNERTNTFTFANGDKLDDRKNRYDREYSKWMDNLLSNIKLPSDSNCFVCNSRTTNAVILP